MDIVTGVWLLISVGSFIAGYLVGKRHGERIAIAATIIKDTPKKL